MTDPKPTPPVTINSADEQALWDAVLLWRLKETQQALPASAGFADRVIAIRRLRQPPRMLDVEEKSFVSSARGDSLE